MIHFLKSKLKISQTIKSEELPPLEESLSTNSTPLIAHTLSAALKDIENGQQPDLTSFPEEIAASLAQHAKAISELGEADLCSTVRFSVQASESMAAVSRITGDVREIDTNAHMMASAIEELDASISQISDTANTSSTDMQQATELMACGTQKVRDTAEATQKTSDAMTTTEGEANQVVEAVEKISEFIGTIEGIAAQTNLLALNATIEAARAGDAGKGFAVVASEVKTLSGQTRTATDDISKLIEGLQVVVGKLFSSVESARLSVSSTQELVVQTEHDISSVNQIVSSTANGMVEIAGVLSEQSIATKELAGGVDQIAQRSEKSAACANEVIEAVRKSEEIIDSKFKSLENREINDYVLYRAKSDHYLWKKNLSEMLVGLNNLTADELVDHHSCRLGKWYVALDDAVIKAHPAFSALEKPHADVHTYGRQAATLFAQGDREGAQAAVYEMETASVEVVRLLDELIAR